MEVFKKGSNVFKILSEAVSESIIIVNKSQIVVATNKAACALFGYSEKELIGAHLDILIPQKHRGNHHKHVNGFIKKSDKRQMGHGRDLHGLHKDGSEFPVEASLNPFSINDNAYVMALIIDISVRKKAEQELKHWANIFNESLNEIFIFDASTLLFLNVNKGALNNIGYTLQELKQLTPIDIKPDFTRAQFLEKIAPLLNDTVEKIKFNSIHQRKDGTTYPVEVHLQKSSTADKNMVVAIILDRTEQENHTQNLEKTVAKRTEQLQEALSKEKELGELKTKFLSLVSHEFKTPLSGILTSATLAGKYSKEDQQEKREKHLKTIRAKVKYLNNIINDFLSIERLESGRVNYTRAEFPLSKVINEVVYDANMLLKEGQQILYPDNIEGVFIETDEKVLHLALTNLLNNAIQYSPENTTISVIVEEEPAHLILHVKDEGMGIPKEEQRYIFDRYYRAENVLLVEGTGIGLNIVKTHIENIGGQVSFMSEQDIGTTFTITLPTRNDKK